MASIETIITCALSSAAVAALITSTKEIIIWKLNRRAKVADDIKDDNEEKDDIKKELVSLKQDIKSMLDKIEKLQKQMDATVEHDKIILRDKIKYLISKYVEYGEITLEERQAIHHMWNIYHYDLGGNGDLNDWMEILDEIQIKEGVLPS